jgi:predicted Fe-Mo cluster-binding NifX family protein
MRVKIAFVSDDGRTISQHFGHASLYVVLTIEDDRVVARELRDKRGHQHLGALVHLEAVGSPHGLGPESRDTHARMAEAIADCQVVVTRGMGRGAHRSLQGLNIQALIVDEADIDEAAQVYIAGGLQDHPERLH